MRRYESLDNHLIGTRGAEKGQRVPQLRISVPWQHTLRKHRGEFIVGLLPKIGNLTRSPQITTYG